MRQGGITAVTFDVGSTLLHPQPSVAQAFTSVANERGHRVRLDDVERHIPAMNDYYEAEYLRDGDFWCSHEGSIAIWLDQYRFLCHRMGLQGDSEGISHAIHRRYWNADHWALYNDVEPCLRALKRRGLALGVISNWDTHLEQLLRDLRLLPYFDVVVSSATVGYRKPHAMIFNLAFEQLGVTAAQVAHVGDLVEADGDGAARAGALPLIIDRHGALQGCPYGRMASLEQVPQLVERACLAS